MASHYLSDYLEDQEDFKVMWSRFRRILVHMGFTLSWALSDNRQTYERKSWLFGGDTYTFYTSNEHGALPIDSMAFSIGSDYFFVSNEDDVHDSELVQFCKNNESLPIALFDSDEEFYSEFFEFLNDYMPAQ